MYTARKKCRFILLLVRLRYSCSGTIGALSSVVLLFLNVRFKVTGAAGSDEEIVAELSQMIEMARKTSD